MLMGTKVKKKKEENMKKRKGTKRNNMMRTEIWQRCLCYCIAMQLLGEILVFGSSKSFFYFSVEFINQFVITSNKLPKFIEAKQLLPALLNLFFFFINHKRLTHTILDGFSFNFINKLESQLFRFILCNQSFLILQRKNNWSSPFHLTLIDLV